MSTPRLVIVAVALLSAACSETAAGPPDIVVDRSACSHCTMFVSEPIFAAAYQAPGQEPRLFDDIGCMLDALRRETAAPIDVWLQDAGGGGWLDADEAIVVGSQQVRTPMSGGWLAYANEAAAEQAATAHGGEVVRSFRELMSREGDAR